MRPRTPFKHEASLCRQNIPPDLSAPAIRRVEDAPLIAGKGCYTEDIQLPGMVHLALKFGWPLSFRDTAAAHDGDGPGLLLDPKLLG